MGMAIPSDNGDDATGANPLHSLAAEATASADGVAGTEQLTREERARKALECDCVAELRQGPCGSQFSEAFYCFLTSTAEEQGSDCIKPFIAMQTCMAANPEAFVQHRDEERNEEEATIITNKQQQQEVPCPPAAHIRNPIL